MKLLLLPPALAIVLFACSRAAVAEEPLFFSELKVGEGRIYRECTVTHSDAEGFLIRHAAGMARISFFDVEDEIRNRFDFDPVEALRLYKIREERERELRKLRVYEAEKQKAQMAELRAKQEKEQQAREEWPPVIAKVILETGDGLIASASRVTFVPTKEISTLGFERDGPPRRVLKPFTNGVIFLEGAKPQAADPGEWKGFVNPEATGTMSHPQFRGRSIPVHLAVPRR